MKIDSVQPLGRSAAAVAVVLALRDFSIEARQDGLEESVLDQPDDSFPGAGLRRLDIPGDGNFGRDLLAWPIGQ